MSEILDGLNIYQQPTRTAAEAGDADEVYVVIYDVTGTHRKTYKMLGTEFTKLLDKSGAITMPELASDPSAPATNNGTLFFRDNGSNKTQLCVKFATGNAIVIATQV